MGTTLKAKQLITTSLSTGTISKPSHIAFGTGDSAFNETDTTMDSETVRNLITDTTIESQTIEWTGTLTTLQGNSTDIVEAGLFDAASAGNMFSRKVIYPISKTSSFEYDFTFVMRVK